MEEENIIGRLIDLLQYSTCNFLAVDAVTNDLEERGFTRLYEREAWDIRPGGKYYVTKNNSAVFAFVAGSEPIEEAGVRIISAHTDSPCFKLKPNCEIYGDGGVVSLNVEKYGGGILYTWFDRPLSISGRVLLRGESAMEPREILIDLERPVATIPHLAIHFNRAVNEGNPLSVQKDMKPVVGYYSPEEIEDMKTHGGLIRRILADELNACCEEEDFEMSPAPLTLIKRHELFTADDILDYELCLYRPKARVLSESRSSTYSLRVSTTCRWHSPDSRHFLPSVTRHARRCVFLPSSTMRRQAQAQSRERPRPC